MAQQQPRVLTLPDQPTGEWYEEFVAACLLTSGYFTETNLVLREGTSDVLELDIVATPSGVDFHKPLLYEAKSKNWGFGDLFKLYGWMHYLTINQGTIVHRNPVDLERSEALRAVCERTNIRCCCLPVDGDTAQLASPVFPLDDVQRKHLRVVSRWQHAAVRFAYHDFVRHCRDHPGDANVARAREYCKAVERSFFAQTPLDRARHLYHAYMDTPRVPGGFVDDISTKEASPKKAVWDRVWNTHDLPWLQYLVLLEHRARIRVMKNALEHAHKHSPGTPVAKDGRPRAISWEEMAEDMMPGSFLEAVAALREHSHAQRIPYLFQVFVELFGGFYYPGTDDEALLAAVAGVPRPDLSTMLQFYDQLFPFGSGWLFGPSSALDGMSGLKMVPAFQKGIGAYLRSRVYGLNNEYRHRYPRSGGLLSQWHSSLFHVLEPHVT